MTRGDAPARYELTTAVSNLRHLRASDLAPYDAVYLGSIYCRIYEANFLECPEDLREAIRLVLAQGKRAYLTTYAAPRSDALPAIRTALEAAAREGATAVEVHSLGLMKLARDEVPGLAIHVGSFANAYTDLGVSVLQRFGATRVHPSHELGLGEIDRMARDTGVPMELTIHGKIPLGVSELCALLPYEAELGVRCPDLCQQDVLLQKDGWGLKCVGKGVLAGRDLCLLDHLPRLVAAGHRHFRIEAVSESPAYRLEVGRVYRAALRRALDGDYAVEAEWWETVRAHARLGLANGFAFGQSGMDYVGAGEARSREGSER